MTVDSRRDAHDKLHRIAWMNTVMNFVLALGKGIIGVVFGSQALVADAVHSAADVVGSLAVVIGLRIARKPPDEDHPYGHGKAEVIAASIVAGFLLAAGIQVGYESTKSLFFKPVVPSLIAAIAAFVAIVWKELLFRYNYRLGKRLNSKGLLASAYDHRSDVFSSLAALLGILLSILGHHLHIRLLLRMDAIAGILVAILVLKIAVHIAQDSLQTLMDRVVLDNADIAPYNKFISHVSGVLGIDDLRVRDHGQYVIIDVKICVDGQITVEAGHDIAREVKRQMMESFPRVHDVFVHINPFRGDETSQGRQAP